MDDMEQKVATLKAALERQAQREHRLRTTVTVLLSRSENQILVLETLLKRLVQVCVHTQDRRLAKELKLIDFTRLAKTLSVDHMQLRQLIGSDDALDSRYLDNLNKSRVLAPGDDIMQAGGGAGFRGDPTHLTSPSGRHTPDLMKPRRGDSSGHDNVSTGPLGNLWNGDGMPMQSMQFNGGGGGGPPPGGSQQSQQQMMRGQGNMGMGRAAASMGMSSQDRANLMRDNLGGSGLF